MLYLPVAWKPVIHVCLKSYFIVLNFLEIRRWGLLNISSWKKAMKLNYFFILLKIWADRKSEFYNFPVYTVNRSSIQKLLMLSRCNRKSKRLAQNTTDCSINILLSLMYHMYKNTSCLLSHQSIWYSAFLNKYQILELIRQRYIS